MTVRPWMSREAFMDKCAKSDSKYKVVRTGMKQQYTCAAISFDGLTRYCTLRDGFWKYLGK